MTIRFQWRETSKNGPAKQLLPLIKPKNRINNSEIFAD